jgi:hypothetical protein
MGWHRVHHEWMELRHDARRNESRYRHNWQWGVCL